MQLRTLFFKDKLPPVGAPFDSPAFDVTGDDLSLDVAITIARTTADREQVTAFMIEESGRVLARWMKVNGKWSGNHA